MEGRWIDLKDYALEFFNKPTVMETFVDILICAVPIWAAVMIGLLIGWSWSPRWTGLIFISLRSKSRFIWTVPVGVVARRFWFAFTALSVLSFCRRLWFNFHGRIRKMENSSVSELIDYSPAPTPRQSDDVCGGDIKWRIKYCYQKRPGTPVTSAL